MKKFVGLLLFSMLVWGALGVIAPQGTSDAAEISDMARQAYKLIHSDRFEEAISFLRKEIEQGNAEAMLILGDLHHEIKDDENAVILWKAAADHGNADGQMKLGLAYYVGLGGLPENKQLAVTLLKKAALQGSEKAKETLDQLKQK